MQFSVKFYDIVEQVVQKSQNNTAVHIQIVKKSNMIQQKIYVAIKQYAANKVTRIVLFVTSFPVIKCYVCRTVHGRIILIAR